MGFNSGLKVLNVVLLCACNVQNAYNSEPSYDSYHHGALSDSIELTERNKKFVK
jgi:hypothetical protein